MPHKNATEGWHDARRWTNWSNPKPVDILLEQQLEQDVAAGFTARAVGVGTSRIMLPQIMPDAFSALIWRGYRKNHPANPGQFCSGKTICVTRTMEMWHDKPVIIAKDESQIRVDC